MYQKKIISIELASSTTEFKPIVGFGAYGTDQEAATDNARAVRTNTWLDFLLIILYWGWF
jgi:hypothetical protein